MIRPFLVLLACLCLTATSFGQSVPDSSVYRVHRNGDLTDGYWRFRVGDSLAWANPAYADSHWQTKVSPDDPLIQNKALWQSGRGWFRLRFRLDKRWLAKEATLSIRQLGRAEWYLDGKRIASPGMFDQDTLGNQRVDRFTPLPITDTTIHVLAVRYQFRRDPVLTATFEEAAFAASITEGDAGPISLLVTESLKVGVAFLMTGIFATLSLLHFLFYRANRTQRVNKLLGWEMLAFAVAFSAHRLDRYTGSLTTDSLLRLTGDLAMQAGLILLLTAIYRYLNLKQGWYYYVVVSLLLLNVAYMALIGEVPYDLDGIAYLLLGIDYLRISWIGRRRKDAYSRLPWVSIRTALYCFLSLVVLVLVLTAVEFLYKKQSGVTISINISWAAGLVFLTVVVGLLSFPVGLSLSLVQDYTRTYRSLGDKLNEVERLSAQTLAQEQEKQALLAQQNETLERQVRQRTAELNQSLVDLRTTQDQLIQREKLASLGELTAGVAHEIQNPLNFVNNFADVSVELMTELEDEQARPTDERDEGLEREILTDIKTNVGKISEHGKRAASIVRGMLQHSRTATGQAEPTDLNALANEYLRLAYQGLRAADKAFEALLVTHLDPALPTVAVVPSDIGRVLTNLLTNAFHAVRDRARQARQQGAAFDETYVPTVTLTTEQGQKWVRIRVRDNGCGIPDSVRSKIFQPFFTTKPTGQGTGLGLSISYDIVTKGHNGTLTLHSEPGAYTEFVVELPTN